MLLALELRVLRGGAESSDGIEPEGSDLETRLRAIVPRAERWVARELGPFVDYEDALQEGLIALALAYERFDGRSSFETYAYRIIVRAARRHRRSMRPAPLEALPPEPSRVDPEGTMMNQQALRALYRALDRLPEKRRTAFVLCAIEGLSAFEAAEREGTRASTMRSRLRHARREIARLLSHDSYLCELMGVRR